MAGTYSRATDVLVIGGGPGGYVSAIRLGQLGKKALLVEKSELGGECLNRGCIPSKALIHASQLYYALTHEAAELGVESAGSRFDLAKAHAWKEAVVAKERAGVSTLLKAAGVTVLHGEARLVGPRSAEFTAPDGGRERIDFEAAVIATGAVHTVLPGFEPDGDRVLNSDQLLSMKELPSSMLILGAGVSGCELGEFLAQVGVRVTLVELLPQILPGLERDLAHELHRTLEGLGVSIHLETRATGLRRDEDSVRLTVRKAGGTEELTANRLFVTVGKRPLTNALGLEEANVRSDPKTGFIPVSDRQETSQPGIYAVGDVGRPPMLAHKAYREGVVAAEAIAGRPTRFQFQAMPSVVFTTPEIATVGLSLADAERTGVNAREVRFPYAALGRAHAAHATAGWVKLVGEEKSGLLLGLHAVGERSGEFVTEAGLAIELGATVRDVALTIHPHPTFSEAVQEAALLWLEEPMHVARRGPSARSP